MFNDVKVPSSNLIGKVGGAGICMMRNLEIERLAAAAMSIGSTRTCLEIMTRY